MEEPYNISLYPGTGSVDGSKGDHVIISPAYNINKDDIANMIDLTAKVIEDYFAELEAKMGSEITVKAKL